MTATILLVDDEPYVTHALRRALRHHDYDIQVANGADEAIALLRRREVDVIVCDEQMPGTPGSVLLTQVREEWPEIERFILTGEASVDAAMRAINGAQVYRFLTKPCDPDELAGFIDQALAERDVRRLLAAAGAEDESPNQSRFDDALDGLQIWFQPIRTITGGIAAHEVLMRPMHESLPMPVDLISAAARLGRELDLDRRVRSMVGDHIRRVPESGRLFVNVLPASLCDDQLLTDDPLTPHAANIVLEVTERSSLSSIPNVAERVAQLRELGYGVALDDLGAGYAGLTSFALLAPDVVKFDMDLVRDIDTSKTQRQLIESMTRVCRDLGATTIAEGIETEAEMSVLAELGCDLFQGYLLGKPSPTLSH